MPLAVCNCWTLHCFNCTLRLLQSGEIVDATVYYMRGQLVTDTVAVGELY